jgi:hypothetical protein
MGRLHRFEQNMAQECKDEERAAQVAGDEYYHAVTKWLTDPERPEEQKKKVFVLSRAYHRSLEFVRRCYSRFRNRPETKPKLEQAVELQKLLEKDMSALAPSAQADEA